MLTRQQTAALRGFAIIGIILHNYTHWLDYMVKENEYTFNIHNVRRILVEMAHPSRELISHLFSFFGHYGVPVFVFLSAYGLVCKYEKSTQRPMSCSPQLGCGAPAAPVPDASTSGPSPFVFIASHFKKLFMMMIAGYAAFLLIDLITPKPHHYTAWNIIGQLGMFSNLYAVPDKAIWPGPYWFFGLMLQLYIYYRFVLYRGSYSLSGTQNPRVTNTVTALSFCLPILAFLLLDIDDSTMNWLRYNCFGSISVFTMGVYYARKKDKIAMSRNVLIATALLSLVFIVAGSMTEPTWHLVPMAVCIFAIALIQLTPQQIIKPLAWVGGISAGIFVSHPIARKITIPVARQEDLWTGLLLYIICAIMLGLVFSWIQDRMKGSKK